MGHHDEIIFGDAHFPGESCNENIIRADGLRIDDLLDAILPLFVLDHVIEQPVMMMGPLPKIKQIRKLLLITRMFMTAMRK
jgi:L-fucose mutarotase